MMILVTHMWKVVCGYEKCYVLVDMSRYAGGSV